MKLECRTEERVFHGKSISVAFHETEISDDYGPVSNNTCAVRLQINGCYFIGLGEDLTSLSEEDAYKNAILDLEDSIKISAEGKMLEAAQKRFDEEKNKQSAALHFLNETDVKEN